jgi:hypothetical protein
LRLIDDRIDLRQHVAGFDILAFLEIDRQQFAINLRAYRNGVVPTPSR